MPIDNRKALDLAVDELGRLWMITLNNKVWRRDDVNDGWEETEIE